jgi:hypothetical protein
MTDPAQMTTVVRVSRSGRITIPHPHLMISRAAAATCPGEIP